MGSVLGGSDCVRKKFWDSEAASVVGGFGCSFLLFVQLHGFSAVGNYGEVHVLKLGVGFINYHV